MTSAQDSVAVREPQAYIDGAIVGACVECGAHLDEDQVDWAETVNLTPDALFVGSFAANLPPAIGEDTAYDWCNSDCFGQWLHRAVVKLKASRRQELIGFEVAP